MPRSVTARSKKDETARPRRRAEHHAELLAGLINQNGLAHASIDDADAYSIEEFCRKNRISVQMFYKRPDLMPNTFTIGKRRLISREAAVRWRAEREAASAAK